jgi:hypothetical protein
MKKAGGLGTKTSVNWLDQRLNWGLSTTASRNWLDQWLNQKFKYQGVDTLIRPTDKPKVQRVKNKVGRHKAYSGSTRPSKRYINNKASGHKAHNGSTRLP